MPRPLPWFKIHAGFSRHGKIAPLTDAQRWTWICCLDAAAQQSPRGCLGTSLRTAAYVTMRPASHLKVLVAARLLDQHEDGSIWVHDWRDWQRTDVHDRAVGAPESIQVRASGDPESRQIRARFDPESIQCDAVNDPDSRQVRSRIDPDSNQVHAVGSPDSRQFRSSSSTSTSTSSSLPLPSGFGNQDSEQGETGERETAEAEAEADTDAAAAARTTAWERAALRALRGARGYEFSDADALTTIRDAATVLAPAGLDVVHVAMKLRDYCNNPPPGQRRPASLLTALTRWADQELGYEVAV